MAAQASLEPAGKDLTHGIDRLRLDAFKVDRAGALDLLELVAARAEQEMIGSEGRRLGPALVVPLLGPGVQLLASQGGQIGAIDATQSDLDAAARHEEDQVGKEQTGAGEEATHQRRLRTRVGPAKRRAPQTARPYQDDGR